MATYKNLVFSAAVRGFHIYRQSWKPRLYEELQCSHERDNPYDSCAVKVFDPASPDDIKGHLPLEISRITKFLLDRGAEVAIAITGRHYRRSPLVQGGLEVPCQIKITMVGSIINHVLMARYEELLNELYTEPKEEEIIGTFLSLQPAEDEPVSEDVDEDLDEDVELETVQPNKRTKTNNKGHSKQKVKCKDIRNMFHNANRKKAQEKNNDTDDDSDEIVILN